MGSACTKPSVSSARCRVVGGKRLRATANRRRSSRVISIARTLETGARADRTRYARELFIDAPAIPDRVDDDGLLEMARGGDEAAFSQLFARHQRPIYLYAARMCGADAGDDIVQETFLAVLRQTGTYDATRGSVGGYLFG